MLSIPIAARWRRTGVTTVPEYLHTRFGQSTRYFFSIIGLPSRIIDNGNRIYTTAVFAGAALGIGKALGLWGSSAIITFYTFIGGLWAVLATDVIQFFLMTVATAAVALLGFHFIGGVSTFINNAPEGFWQVLGNPEFNFGYLFALAIIGFVNGNGYWSLIQRYTATKSDREAMKVPLISGLAGMTVLMIIYLPPMMAPQVVADKVNALVESGMPLAVAAERGYVFMCLKLLPAGVMGFIVVAMFCATMSALSSEYNIMSAVCTKDLYQGLIKKDAHISEKRLLWLGRYTTLAIALACTLIGSQIDKMGGAFKFLFIALGLTSGPTYIPPLLGLFFRRTPAWGANLAFIAGLISGIITKFGTDLSLFWVVLINSTVTVGTFFLAGLIDPIKGEQKEKVEGLFKKLGQKQKGSLQEDPEKTRLVGKSLLPNINGAIGLGTSLFGFFLFIIAFITRADGGFLTNFVCSLILMAIGIILLLKPSNQ
jgi:SSS family transporter